jgi:hypothetical protein
MGEAERLAPASTSWRPTYVTQQLRTARQALALGSNRVARAALRVLSGEDFTETEEASALLRTLRGRGAEPDDVMAALRRLCALTPVAARPR